MPDLFGIGTDILALGAAALGRHEDGGQAEKRLDRLRPQFHRAQPELQAVLDDVVAAHRRIAEAVRDVEADVYPGNLGVWFRSGGRRLERVGR